MNTPIDTFTQSLAQAAQPYTNAKISPAPSTYTVLANSGVIPTFDLDGAVKPGGKFFLSVAGTYNIASLPESGQIILARNYPVTGAAAKFLGQQSSTSTVGLPVSKTATGTRTTPLVTGIYFDANVNVLGNYVDLQGTMQGNGDFTIQGSAAVNISSSTGSAVFTLSDTQAQGFKFTGAMDANFTSTYVRGGLHANFTFGIADNNLTYQGNAHAWGQVYPLTMRICTRSRLEMPIDSVGGAASELRT